MRNYAVVIHEEPEGVFWGEVPALPGCYSQGETVEELKHNIHRYGPSGKIHSAVRPQMQPWAFLFNQAQTAQVPAGRYTPERTLH